LGVAYYQQAKLAEAEKAFRAALAERPDDAEWHYNLGGVLAALNRFDEATTEFLRAKELDPDLPEPHLGLGSIYKLQGKDDEAIAALKEYLRLAPDDSTTSQWRQQAEQMLTELGAQP
jgi:tetratricopeptide (TPR) repeat protein